MMASLYQSASSIGASGAAASTGAFNVMSMLINSRG